MHGVVLRSTWYRPRFQTAPIWTRRCAPAVVVRSRARQPSEAASEKLPFALFGDTAAPEKRKFDEAAVENMEAIKAKVWTQEWFRVVPGVAV